MKSRWNLLGLVALFVALFFVGRLGSVTFALGLAGLIAVLLLNYLCDEIQIRPDASEEAANSS